MNERELINTVTSVGSGLVRCGAEICRAEDSMKRICEAYGYDDAEIFAVPSVIIVTLHDRSGYPVTETVRISGRETNLDRVDKYNNLSRMICGTKPQYRTVRSYISAIEKRSCYTKEFTAISYAAVGASAALSLGGSWKESLTAALAALLIYVIINRINSGVHSAGVFMKTAVSSMAAAALCAVVSRMGFIPGFDKAVIAAVMTLVPGVAITNCMRDLLAGDILAGLYTLTEALLTAAGVAVGTGTVVAAFVNL